MAKATIFTKQNFNLLKIHMNEIKFDNVFIFISINIKIFLKIKNLKYYDYILLATRTLKYLTEYSASESID